MVMVPPIESSRARGWITDSELMVMWFVPVKTAPSEIVMLEEKVTGGFGPDCDTGGMIEWRLAAELAEEDIAHVQRGSLLPWDKESHRSCDWEQHSA